MMCTVADSNTSDESAPGGRNEGGVLANLPRTRPQRSTARRAAARGTSRAPARDGKATRPRGVATAHPGAAATETAPAPVRDSSASARAKAGGEAAKAGSSKVAKRKAAPRRPAAGSRRSAASDDAAPRQGFESDCESAGGSVAPPGGAELVATAAEIVGELAKAGLSTGERLFKDVLSRLPLS
jgi:hypothetical protein